MLQIIKFPNDILREKMPEFDFSNPTIDPKQLEKEMISVMFAHNGIGLAANQVGVRARMFVMGQADYPDHAVGIFNPVVEEAMGTDETEEACLSFPGIWAKVKRPKKIKARWQDSSGEWQSAEIEDMTCRCFLHELDHLEGIVYQDRLSPLKWAMSVKKSTKNKRKY
jgi:peptide deformylase